ncbi:hypothetical protein MIB92_15015 [Aestuariirhabdus sp. Z084]|uniref:hypothetical protein n=1 Tax=Aestuariirhabdus haliotis TaxID=2918751 RepID=UPI00201B40B4|nr:hypothetical protein [Aestuariirhabdus haliotis]MCL6416970.1 hypothetical protein [Aestuariirhabdus haliotis]MCL6421023.1 hypothetical protein [Aestuariirhabdus haliotis]
MKKLLFSVLWSVTCLSTPAIARSDMDDQQLSKYLGVIKCIDRSFFGGGYSPGEPGRETLMNALLSKEGLPAFNESMVGLKPKDMDSYMEGYSACDNNWPYISAEAEKIGMNPEAGYD